MSGHSKWNNIKRKKEATDAIKGKIFTKIGREITVCVKEGGPDPSSNAKLRDLIAKAKSNNVPNDNIDRVIKKAAGEGDKNNYESIVYEGYGPCGVAVIVETLTDNKNRTAGDIRHYFDKEEERIHKKLEAQLPGYDVNITSQSKDENIRLIHAGNDRTYGYEKREDTNFIVTSGISDWAIKFKTGCKSEYVVIDVSEN